MTKEEITAVAEKIKAGTATEEEKVEFQKEVSNFLSKVKDLLEK